MAAKSKVYVIDPTSKVEAFLQKGGKGKRGFEQIDYSPDGDAQNAREPLGAREPRGARKRRRRPAGPLEEQGSPLAAFLSYLAGPFAVIATRHGRESAFWIAVAALSSVLATFLFARADRLFAAPHGSGVSFVVWLLLGCLAAAMGFAAWARGAYMLGRHKGHLLRKLPASLRHPAAAGFLGLVIPGFGLFIAGHPRRAAGALLAVGAAAISVIVLWQAPDLWQLSRAGILVQHGDTLERIFLLMAGLGVFGALAWIVQALDGARLAGAGGEGTEPRHGDWSAVALVLAIAALLVTFKPARVAETIDTFAVSLRADGLRAIPLVAAETAMRLDPSRPEYAMRAMDLNEELGRTYRAGVLQCYLEDRWQPYERMLRLEAAAD